MPSLGSMVEINPPGGSPSGPVSLISVADLDALTKPAVPVVSPTRGT